MVEIRNTLPLSVVQNLYQPRSDRGDRQFNVQRLACRGQQGEIIVKGFGKKETTVYGSADKARP